jgi:acyl-coenzyme A synthetase/AMP-(fatty) acid ligase
MLGEKLIIVMRLNEGQEFSEELKQELIKRNAKLLNFKRISGFVIWDEDFPRTASMKIKRIALAEAIRARCSRDEALKDL